MPLLLTHLKQWVDSEGAMIIDTRHQTSFTKEHIPGSIFFGIDGGFAPWVGALVSDINQPIIIVADEGTGGRSCNTIISNWI